MYHVYQKIVLSTLLQQVSDAVRRHCSTIIYFVVLYRHITFNFSSPNIFDEKRFKNVMHIIPIPRYKLCLLFTLLMHIIVIIHFETVDRKLTHPNSFQLGCRHVPLCA